MNLSYSLIFPSTSTCLSNSTLSFLVPQQQLAAHVHTYACVCAHTGYCSAFASPHVQNTQQLKKKSLFSFLFLKPGQGEDDCNSVTDSSRQIAHYFMKQWRKKSPKITWSIPDSWGAAFMRGGAQPSTTTPREGAAITYCESSFSLLACSAAQGGEHKQSCALSLTNTDLSLLTPLPNPFLTLPMVHSLTLEQLLCCVCTVSSVTLPHG